MAPPVDPQLVLAPRFQAAIAAAFGDAHRDADPMLRASDRADLQANVAMGLAKRVGQPPRKVAEAILAKLDADDVLEKVELAGPGFFNLTLRADWLAAAAGRTLADARLCVQESDAKERVVIDYSSPNVAKEMHVGHLRSTVIGDALARVLAFRGHTIVRQNHVGDWGTPFGMLIEHLLDVGEDAAAAELGVGELGTFYKAARQKFDDSEAFAARARARVVSLQRGDAETRRLWGVLVDVSKRYFESVYARLGVTLGPDDVAGESLYDPRLAPLAEELRASGAAVVTDGALCLFPPGFSGKDGAPLPLIVQKSDGGFGYATTDLAAIRYRLDELHATRLLYVVGAPQAQHLAMIFEAARTLGWLRPPARATHVSFGSVLGTDKRMFKTRSGDTVRLVDLIDEAEARALAVVEDKARDLDEPTRAKVARMIGVGAIKYADLSSDRVKDYVFDLDRMLAFDGNTAPYLQYAHARLCSIFRKAEAEGIAPGPLVPASGEGAAKERALLLQLLSFGAVVAAVEATLEPHKLCTYLYELATGFMAFYEACPVLKADGPVRASRLSVCELTRRTLRQGLELLGIEAPEKM